MLFIPKRCADVTFSLTPPIGNTFPRNVISPVIANPSVTDLSDNSETRAVSIPTPADGPSFGVAPAGTWIWISVSL